MSPATAVASFVLIWWITLFAVLPWGVRSQHEGEDKLAPGTDPGAPITLRFGRKLAWTTVIAALIFAGFYGSYVGHLLSLDYLVNLLGVHYVE